MFALVDCNSFYASVERLWLPAIRSAPVVVLSNNDGCIVSLTPEAKAIGLVMGTPYHEARPLITAHRVAVFSSNYVLYGDLSARVLSTLRTFAEEIENYSIDESFLLFSPGVPDYTALARTIKATVGRDTGIPVSVGVGPTKVLAKLANRLAKKRPEMGGVMLMPDGVARDEVLRSVDVDMVWGIGSQLTARLAAQGVKTAFDLAQMSDAAARRVMTVTGARIAAELRGVSCLDIEEVAPAKQNIVVSRSFGAVVTELGEMREAVANYMTRAAEKMRRNKSVCAQVRVFIQTNPFRENTPQWFGHAGISLDTPTGFTPTLIGAALCALDRCWRDGFVYKKAGVMLLDLHSEREVQSAFTTPAPAIVARRQVAMRTLDRVNRDFGRGAVTFAAAGLQARWQMKRAMCSPRYTTRWTELREVVA